MADAEDSNRVKEYLILGPSNAGKTALLSTLRQALFSRDRTTSNVDISITGENDEMLKLMAQAGGTIRNGSLPIAATNDLTKYQFTLSVSQRRFGIFPRERLAQFTVWDGPGGSMFPAAQDRDTDTVALNRFRAQLDDSLKSADGVMICLDASDASKALIMFEAFPEIFSRTGMSKLPCRRICICLTKADRRFAEHGTKALAELDRADALDVCSDLLPRVAMGVLSSYCRDANFGFSWSSVYGFLPNGEPNYDAVKDKLREWDEQTKHTNSFVNRWIPFGVLDPLLWISGGDKGSLIVVRANQLI